MLTILSTISSLTILIPFGVIIYSAGFNVKKLGMDAIVFYFYICYAVINEVYMNLLKFQSIHNLWLLDYFIPIEAFLLSFYLLHVSSKNLTTFKLISSCFITLVLVIVNIMITDKIDDLVRFNVIVLFENILIFLLAVNAISTNKVTEKTSIHYWRFQFFVILGIMLINISSIFIWSFNNLLPVVTLILFLIGNTATNFIYGIGLRNLSKVK